MIIVTGAAGLVGSSCVRLLCSRGIPVVGIDNGERGRLFGMVANTLPVLGILEKEFPRLFVACRLDINWPETAAVFQNREIDGVIHAAAQPSHDYAAGDPVGDFTINASGTLRILELVRKYCPEAVFIQVSTNKVYGDAVNRLDYVERSTRFEPVDGTYKSYGIPETFSIDQSMHSLFGVSKLYGDLVAQEYGRYFGLRTSVFRCGCITGAAHAGVEAHGFLSYLVKCIVQGRPYTIYGYEGRQVRDQIHADDLASAFLAVLMSPPAFGTVFNMGGGTICNCSVLEALHMCGRISGNAPVVRGGPERLGDHKWWVSDTSKFCNAYPDWKPKWDLVSILEEIVEKAKG